MSLLLHDTIAGQAFSQGAGLATTSALGSKRANIPPYDYLCVLGHPFDQGADECQYWAPSANVCPTVWRFGVVARSSYARTFARTLLHLCPCRIPDSPQRCVFGRLSEVRLMQNTSKYIYRIIINLACRTHQRTHLRPHLIGLTVEQGARQLRYRASDAMSPLFCYSACLP